MLAKGFIKQTRKVYRLNIQYSWIYASYEYHDKSTFVQCGSMGYVSFHESLMISTDKAPMP